MFIDLTHASYRVLKRAGIPNYIPAPGRETMLTPEKVLLSLFEEEESRAAAWLAEAGLDAENFRNDFGIPLGIQRLRSAVSAPPFPMGDYGIAPGAPGAEAPRGTTADYLVGGSAADRPVIPDDPSTRESPPIRDEVVFSGTASPGRPSVPMEVSGIRAPQPLRFRLDGEPVDLSRVAPELVDAFLTALARLTRYRPEEESVMGQAGTVRIRSVSGSTGIAFATEHLLFTLTLTDGALGNWLRQQRFDPTEVFERIERLYADSGREDIPCYTVSRQTEKREEKHREQYRKNRDAGTRDTAATTETRASKDAKDAGGFQNTALLRLLDAAENRAREALRVLEDYARFACNDEDATRALKEIRHELGTFFRDIPQSLRLAARDTTGDVGTDIATEDEYARSDLGAVLAANFARLQESLRSLEEYSKLFPGAASRTAERLRYRCYIIQKSLQIWNDTTVPPDDGTGPATENLALDPDDGPQTNGLQTDAQGGDFTDRRSLIDKTGLYLLIGGDGRKEPSAIEAFTRLVRQAVAAGAGAVQLRDKNPCDRDLLTRARLLRELTAGSRTLCIINDRADIAAAVGADGVHLGQEDLSVADARRIVGTKILIGVSTHSPGQARQAFADGADYIGVGPVFPSTTKDFAHVKGTELLRDVAALGLPVPAFAIGGIAFDNLDEVLATGFTRIAVGAAVSGSANPEETVRKFLARLAAASTRGDHAAEEPGHGKEEDDDQGVQGSEGEQADEGVDGNQAQQEHADERLQGGNGDLESRDSGHKGDAQKQPEGVEEQDEGNAHGERQDGDEGENGVQGTTKPHEDGTEEG